MPPLRGWVCDVPDLSKRYGDDLKQGTSIPKRGNMISKEVDGYSRSKLRRSEIFTWQTFRQGYLEFLKNGLKLTMKKNICLNFISRFRIMLMNFAQ